MEKIKEPTKEQIEEFWKWCGFKWHFGGEWFYERYKSTNAWWESPDGRKYKDLPPIDLNNLAKYAVPKMQREGFELRFHGGLAGSDFHAMFRTPASTLIGVMQNEDPAFALFWSVWGVMHHED